VGGRGRDFISSTTPAKLVPDLAGGEQSDDKGRADDELILPVEKII
jgi:hypothetical protein